MAVDRISNIKIKEKGLFTAIYGNVNEEEYFVDDDLKNYSLSQALYLYLKSEGYKSVVFYDSADNFHSFSQNDLTTFLKLDIPKSKSQRQTNDDWEIAGPLGKELQSATFISTSTSDNPVHDTIQAVEIYGSSDRYFRTHQTINLLDYLKTNLPGDEKCAVIIKRPESSRFENVDDYVNFFSQLNSIYAKNKGKSKVIIVYASNNSHALMDNIKTLGGYLFTHTYFKDLFFDVKGEKYEIKEKTTFQVEFPEQKEIRNWINRNRILEQTHIFNSVPFDKIILRIAQERKQIKELDSIDLPTYISNISTKSAWDLLNELKGIENIKEQFQKLIKARRKNQAIATTNRFRPHMCFKGNPGTGKTTVAEIFSEILKEENVLNLGQLVKVTVGDLVAENVGGTRIKTQAFCDRAKGGVLFIDEAYGLLDNFEGGFGKESIEVLIQFMENNEDSLVILAGYTDKIDRLLKEGNDGFISRFNKSNHFIFEDYKPDVLCEISKSKLSQFQITEEAHKSICKILALQFNRRNAQWGNAREVENLIQEILTEFYCSEDCIIDVKHIPPHYLNIIDPKATKQDNSGSGIAKLNALTGLHQMKATLKKMLNSIKADKVRNERSGKPTKSYKLNFVFHGNPGTGKTTVARLLGEILTDYGLLSDPKVEECRRDDIVGKYLGHTAPKVKQKFIDSIGRLLFIDEAYSICQSEHDEFGREAINAIVGNLTDENFQGKMAFVIAGYTNEINEFISQNQGLESRFNQFVDFEDYSNEELWEIYCQKVSDADLIVLTGCKPMAIHWFAQFIRDKNFSNGRLAENLLGITKANLDSRLESMDLANLPDETLHTIIEIDFPDFTASSLSKNTTTKPDSDFISKPENVERVPISITIETGHNANNLTDSVGLLKTKDAGGTAFLISKDGYLVTANHVIQHSATAGFFYSHDKIEYPAKVVWASEVIDIAILKIIITKDDFIPINLCFENDDPKSPEKVALIGYPRGGQLSEDPYYSESTIANFSKNFKVSNRISFDAIATYTNATGGYSGGPLIRQRDNKVIGVLHGGLPNEGNINYASDIRQLMNRPDINFIFKTSTTENLDNSVKEESNKKNNNSKTIGETDKKLQEAIEFLLYDYCIIDTNIWMSENPGYRKNNLRSISVLMNIYKHFNKNLIAHGKTYEELKRIKENKEGKYSREVSLAVLDGFNLLSNANEDDLIQIPELTGEHDRKAYADLAIYNYASEKYKNNNSVILVSNDKECRIRVKSALQSYKSEVDFKFLIASDLKQLTHPIFHTDWYKQMFLQK